MSEKVNENSSRSKVLSDKVWDDLLTKNRGTELTENRSWKKEKGNGRKYGIAKGKFAVPDDIDGCNDSIAEMFGVVECATFRYTQSTTPPCKGRGS